MKSAGLEPRRADDLYKPTPIIADIWEITCQAKLILADLTGRNANVFYELGLAHAIAKPAILVAASIDEVPFDLRHLRVLDYDQRAPDWGRILQNKIQKAIKEVLHAPGKAVPVPFLSTKRLGARKSPLLKKSEIVSLRESMYSIIRDLQSSLQTPSPVPSSPRGASRASITLTEAIDFAETSLMLNVPESRVLRNLREHGISSLESKAVLNLVRPLVRVGRS